MMTRKRHFRHLLTTGWQLQAGVCGFKDLNAKKPDFYITSLALSQWM